MRFRQTVDEMNSYLEMHKLPKSLRLRVREYLHAQRECQTRLETSKAVQALSPSLQVEVLMEVQKHFFDKVPFLRRAEAPCVVQISLEMSSGVSVRLRSVSSGGGHAHGTTRLVAMMTTTSHHVARPTSDMAFVGRALRRFSPRASWPSYSTST